MTTTKYNHDEVVAAMQSALMILGLDVTNAVEISITPVAICITYWFGAQDKWHEHTPGCRSFKGGCLTQSLIQVEGSTREE